MTKKIIFYTILLLQASVSGFAQPDSAYIKKYVKNNDVELCNSYTDTRLHFTVPRKRTDRADPLSLYSNGSASTGIYIDYNWITVGFSVNLPNTKHDNKIKDVKAYNFNFDTYHSGWGLSGNFNYFSGLLQEEVVVTGKRRKKKFQLLKDLRYTDISTDILYVLNKKRFSFTTARFLGEKQAKSAGSFIFHLLPAYNAAEEDRSAAVAGRTTRYYLSNQPKWLTLAASAGYIYNFALDGGKWIISPQAQAGYGALYQFNVTTDHFKPVTLIKAGLMMGYNTPAVYVYATADATNMESELYNAYLKQERLQISASVGYRFGSLRKKILGVL